MSGFKVEQSPGIINQQFTHDLIIDRETKIKWDCETLEVRYVYIYRNSLNGYWGTIVYFTNGTHLWIEELAEAIEQGKAKICN